MKNSTNTKVINPPTRDFFEVVGYSNCDHCCWSIPLPKAADDSSGNNPWPVAPAVCDRLS